MDRLAGQLAGEGWLPGVRLFGEDQLVGSRDPQTIDVGAVPDDQSRPPLISVTLSTTDGAGLAISPPTSFGRVERDG